jgi:hypothetical protein
VTEVLASVVVGHKASAVREFALPDVPADAGLLGRGRRRVRQRRWLLALGLGRDSERLRVARVLGADAAFNVETQDATATVRELTGGELADMVIDTAAGNATTLRPALAMLRHTCWPRRCGSRA